MTVPRIRQVRASGMRGGAGFHDQPEGHWIDDYTATSIEWDVPAPISGKGY